MRFLAALVAIGSFLSPALAGPSEGLARFALPPQLGFQGEVVIDRDALLSFAARGNSTLLLDLQEHTQRPAEYIV